MEAIAARKSIDGLAILIQNYFEENSQCGNLFIFFNKSRDKVKILWWDTDGFVLYYKRLEKRCFIIPKLHGLEKLEISEAQLNGLLAGLDFSFMRHYPEINYHSICIKIRDILQTIDIMRFMKTHYDFNNIIKEELLKLVNHQAKQIQFLEEQVLAYQLQQFANKSEKININQALFFDESQLPKSEEN